MFDLQPIQYAEPRAVFRAATLLARGYVDYSFFRIWKRWSRKTKTNTALQRALRAVEKISSPIKDYHINEVLTLFVCPDATGKAVTEAFSRL